MQKQDSKTLCGVWEATSNIWPRLEAVDRWQRVLRVVTLSLAGRCCQSIGCLRAATGHDSDKRTFQCVAARKLQTPMQEHIHTSEVDEKYCCS